MQRSQNVEQGVMGLGIMGLSQVTPMWANHPVWMHNGIRQESGQGRVRSPPSQREIRQREEKGGAG